MLSNNYISMCLSGDALLTDVNDFIDKWHETDTGLSIEDYLGMSKHEYNAWLLDDSILPYIIRSRHEKKDISEVFTKDEMKVAARGSNAEQIVELFKWLKENEE